jgi:hypothetical protein
MSPAPDISELDDILDGEVADGLGASLDTIKPSSRFEEAEDDDERPTPADGASGGDESDEDEQVDEEEDDEGDEENDEGEEDGEDDGQPRNPDGTFAEKSKEGADAPARTEAQGAGKDAVADVAKAGEQPVVDKGAAAAATDPQWQPFSVTVDRTDVAIPEALVQRVGGFVMLGVPEAQYPDFTRRIVRGVEAERQWRGLQEEKRRAAADREFEKTKPEVRTESQIEADLLLERLKPHAAALLEPHELDLIEAHVKIELGKQNDALREWESKRSQPPEPTIEEQQLEGIAETMIELRDHFADELKGLADEDLLEVIRQIAPVRNALYWQDTNEKGEKVWMRNTQYVYDQLKSKAAAKASAASTATRDATPAATGTTASGGTPAADRADRFNKGQDTAARPTSTSLKDRRGTTGARNRPPNRGTTGSGSGKRRDSRTSEQRAEDDFRKTTRGFMSNPGLDIPDDDE